MLPSADIMLKCTYYFKLNEWNLKCVWTSAPKCNAWLLEWFEWCHPNGIKRYLCWGVIVIIISGQRSEVLILNEPWCRHIARVTMLWFRSEEGLCLGRHISPVSPHRCVCVCLCLWGRGSYTAQVCVCECVKRSNIVVVQCVLCVPTRHSWSDLGQNVCVCLCVCV